MILEIDHFWVRNEGAEADFDKPRVIDLQAKREEQKAKEERKRHRETPKDDQP